jgi:cell wall-associated NlpC family hydrolase
MSHVLSEGPPADRPRCHVSLFTALILGFSLAFASCSPYPIYNTSPTRGDKPGTAGDSRAPRAEPVDQPSSVDPQVFTRVVDEYLGSPYKRGGNDRYGIDCSNLVSVVYRDYSGTRVPSSTRGLYQLPHVISPENLAVGDLVFFSFGPGSPSHVGLYMGERRFVHASETEGVIVSSLDDPPYRGALVGARRVLSGLRTEE